MILHPVKHTRWYSIKWVISTKSNDTWGQEGFVCTGFHKQLIEENTRYGPPLFILEGIQNSSCSHQSSVYLRNGEVRASRVQKERLELMT
jgi:hypothetical protein